MFAMRKTLQRHVKLSNLLFFLSNTIIVLNLVFPLLCIFRSRSNNFSEFLLKQIIFLLFSK